MPPARPSPHLALTAIVLAVLVTACGPVQHPLPLDDPPPAAGVDAARRDADERLEGPAPRRAAPPPARAAAAGTRPAPRAAALQEEVLPEQDPTTLVEPPEPAAAGDAAAGAVPPGDFPLAAPSPLAALDAATPPHVAAAIRLADGARLRLAAGDDGTALAQLERAIALDAGNPYAYYFLAELHLRHRTYDQAIAFADRAAELSRTDPRWASRAHELQGNAFEAAGRFGDARQAYTRALRLAPNNVAARSGLARTGAGISPAPPPAP